MNEFETIFKEQFKVIKNYERIVKQISQKSMSKEELGRQLNMVSGGGLSSYIYNLEQADFIKIFKSNAPFGLSREKTRKIVLWDEWLQFYFHYIEPNKRMIELNTESGLFEKVAGQSINSYLGLVFEKFCMKNLSNILKNIGVDIHQVIDYGPFFRQKKRTNPHDEGIQIDILVSKKGQILTLIECKFQSNPIGISVISEVQRKIQLLKAPKSYSIERILITAGEITTNLKKSDYFHHILGIASLFE
ncbi:MAG: phage related ATPase [Candidatus Magnetoglobus multicellularis str. Araruama]|uniref:Phage related ATPase n=1 Tax=Candidatus Magnetoglobus multicellularis str. Araruama TaxID=890399 RepID=A0A1V1NVX3_9BACT|nr:MAG: phage related ATPase [Candidatus Magnetoglobus multicellularis str. Araruama]